MSARPPGRSRRSTSTSNFGVSRRESHDASAFYNRFELPTIDPGDDINRVDEVDVDVIHTASSADMSMVPDNSVALVVTSPPYYAGKAYEEDVTQGHVPSTYLEYLGMLRDVFAECRRVLEPGGRIAVNVANLGRRPYRSLSADIVNILQDDLHLLLRGEIIWQKAKGAGGSCAWGSFQSPGNPVLRDMTERIVVASKGRFDRAVDKRRRHATKLPSEATITRDEFMDLTVDLWEFPPELATRVGHPAPFPVELPRRLIDLYTYADDIVLDPFMGSGTTAVAAVRRDRHFIGFDTDPEFVAAAVDRVRDERERLMQADDEPGWSARVPAVAEPVDADEPLPARATRDGRKAIDYAVELVTECGFTIVETDHRVVTGLTVSMLAADRTGTEWYIDVVGGFSNARPGLAKPEVTMKTIARAAVVQASRRDVAPADRRPYLVLSTDRPTRGSAAGVALGHVTGHGPSHSIYQTLTMLEPADILRLGELADAGPVDAVRE